MSFLALTFVRSRPLVNVVMGRLTGAQEKEAYLVNITFLEGNECAELICSVIQVKEQLDKKKSKLINPT